MKEIKLINHAESQMNLGISGDVIYINPLGVMFSDRVILPLYSTVSPIYYKDLKGVKMKGKRVILINILSLIISLVLCVNTVMGNYTLLERAFILLYSLSFFTLGMFYKKVSYKMILVYKDYTYKNADFKSFLKQDAKSIIRKINKTINKK